MKGLRINQGLMAFFMVFLATQANGQPAAEIRDRALRDPTAWKTVSSLTREVGPRQNGTPAAVKARDWGLAKLKSLGFQNVHAEEFMAESWVRGAESAEVITPKKRKLRILGLGRSISTPPEGVEAEVAVFASFDAMLTAPPGALSGKIAVVNQPMVRTQDGSGYGAINRNRTQGASEAAKRGAVAYLTRSLSTDDGPAVHAGAMRYADNVSKIPAAALSPPDADWLSRQVASGKPVRLRLKLASTHVAAAPAWNIVGEIPGAGPGVIVIGGHLDSWDQGTGAVDDGAGVAITMAAAKLVGDAGRPRHTIRVVLWGAEELGLSGAAYGAAHADEAANIVIASESDGGGGAIWRLRLPKDALSRPQLAGLAARLAPLKIILDAEPATRSGDDTGALHAAGVPAFSFSQDMSRYFDLHHSADDTLDQIDKNTLNQNVAAWAVLLNLIANSGVDFRKAP